MRCAWRVSRRARARDDAVAMNILLFLIPLSLVLLVAAAWAFVWAVRRGQFEDLDTPAIDILRDDPHERPRRGAGLDEGAPASDTAARDDHAD